MILAVMGASGVGKTTLGKLISCSRGWPLRSCGDLARARSSELGISLGSLTIDEHKSIDADTIEWVSSLTQSAIVEGRFLDQVLATCAPNVTLIRLTASDAVRVFRLNARLDNQFDTMSLNQHDQVDENFRRNMYGNAAWSGNMQTIDNSNLSPDECAEWVNAWIDRCRPAQD